MTHFICKCCEFYYPSCDLNLIGFQPDRYRFTRLAPLYGNILYNVKCVSRKGAGPLFCVYCKSLLKRRLHLEWPCTSSRICRDLTDSFPFIIDVYRNDKAVASILPLLDVLTRNFINCSSKYAIKCLRDTDANRVHYELALNLNTDLKSLPLFSFINDLLINFLEKSIKFDVY